MAAQASAQPHLHKYRHGLRLLLRFLLYAVSFFFVCFGWWTSDNFGEPPLDQVLYHLQFGMDGLVDTDAQLIRTFVLTAILLPTAVAFCLVATESAIGAYLTHTARHHIYPAASIVNRSAKRVLKLIYWLISHRAPIYVFTASALYFGAQFSVLAFLHHQFGKDYFAEHYVYPDQVNITPVQPRNLVLIYVESLENTYRQPALFQRNLLAGLDQLGGLSFAAFRQAPGTGWTIAGMTASQCAIPLKSVSLYDGNAQGQNIKTFLPSAVCLGDILHRYGYRNVYMGGDGKDFSGKGMFFQDHHYDEVYGRDELRSGEAHEELNEWGLFDDALLARARGKLDQLHQAGQPFNLTLSTIDTHGPWGHLSQLCKHRGARVFEDVVQCSANQVAEFVQFMRKRGYLKDTNVVIMGDHLAMWNPVYEDKLEPTAMRYVYNRLISIQPHAKNRDAIVHFDMLPTILEFIGFEVEGGKLGLGYSALSNTMPLPPPGEYEDMSENLLNQSERYLDLWRMHHAGDGAADMAATPSASAPLTSAP